MDYEKIISNIRENTEKYLVNGNIKSVVLGVSGGIDSALVAALIQPVCLKLDIPLIGRSISIESNKIEEQERANSIGEYFCTHYDHIDLTSIYEPISLSFNGIPDLKDAEDVVKYKIRNGNIKARLRMMKLYHLASEHGGLVLSTDNWTEYLLGFWTLHGDVGDFGMIQELWKTEVYEMSNWLVYNELKNNQLAALALLSCVKGVATDGLGITNSDLDQILPGFKGTSEEGYKKVDDILKDDALQTMDNKAVLQRHFKSDFKRQNPYNISRNLILNK